MTQLGTMTSCVYMCVCVCVYTQNIRVARDALCALIMGSPPGKVYSRLRNVCARLADS